MLLWVPLWVAMPYLLGYVALAPVSDQLPAVSQLVVQR